MFNRREVAPDIDFILRKNDEKRVAEILGLKPTTSMVLGHKIVFAISYGEAPIMGRFFELYVPGNKDRDFEKAMKENDAPTMDWESDLCPRLYWTYLYSGERMSKAIKALTSLKILNEGQQKELEEFCSAPSNVVTKEIKRDKSPSSQSNLTFFESSPVREEEGAMRSNSSSSSTSTSTDTDIGRPNPFRQGGV